MEQVFPFGALPRSCGRPGPRGSLLFSFPEKNRMK
jgi:hypothetical protein